MKIKNSPELFISVSSSPGKFGETVHNSAFRFHKLNYVYKAIRALNIKEVVKSIRALDVRGCSVSMPFKEKIIPYLDKVDSLANRTGAVNTVLNKNNKLIGYNTDIYGATQALKSIDVRSRDDILILGAGGVSRAIITALKKSNNHQITIANRDFRKCKKLANLFQCNYIEWDKRNEFKATVLINATSVGMKNNNVAPINMKSIASFNKVMDVVVSNTETKIIMESKRLNITNVTGMVMTFYQAFEQYKIYTGLDAPKKNMLDAYSSKYLKKVNI